MQMEDMQRLGEIESYQRGHSPDNWGEGFGECDAPSKFTFAPGVTLVQQTRSQQEQHIE